MAHSSEQDLKQRLLEAAQRVQVGSTYVHYKDPSKHYVVTQLVIIEATEEVGVVYQAQYGEEITFLRPLTEWDEVISEGVSRFRRQESI